MIGKGKRGNKIKKTIFILITVVMVVTTGMTAGCGGAEMPAEPLEEITFGSSATHKIGAVFVGKSKGYFEEEGIDLTVKQFGSGKASFEAMLRDEVEISAVADTPIMFESFRREDFYIIAGMYTSFDDKIIARKDNGISSIADLRGKRVGLTKGTNAQFVLDLFLIRAGISPSEVEVVDIQPLNLPSALENGEVDAISAWEPIPFEAEQLLPGKTIKFLNDQVYRKIFYFAVKKEFLRNHPETIKRFLKVIDRANTFIRKNEDESQDIVVRELKLDKEAIELGWQQGEFTLFLDQALIMSLEAQARWAVKNDLTEATEIPNYLDYIYMDALEEVNPEAVSIIR